MYNMANSLKQKKIWKKSLIRYMKLIKIVGLDYDISTDEFIYDNIRYTNIQDLMNFIDTKNITLFNEVHYKHTNNDTEIFTRTVGVNIYNELRIHHNKIRCF